MKPKVLFVCIHNSARSQMAEAFLKQIGGDDFDVYSAGLEAGTLNPHVVKAMAEIGINIAQNATKTVNDPAIKDMSFDYVITVCQESRAATCPIVPTNGTRIAWHFQDPSEFSGSEELQMKMTRFVRDRVKEKVAEWYAGVRSATVTNR